MSNPRLRIKIQIFRSRIPVNYVGGGRHLRLSSRPKRRFCDFMQIRGTNVLHNKSVHSTHVTSIIQIVAQFRRSGREHLSTS
jgi:hypothetical protein